MGHSAIYFSSTETLLQDLRPSLDSNFMQLLSVENLMNTRSLVRSLRFICRDRNITFNDRSVFKAEEDTGLDTRLMNIHIKIAKRYLPKREEKRAVAGAHEGPPRSDRLRR